MCFFSSEDVTKLELHWGCEHLYGVSPATAWGSETGVRRERPRRGCAWKDALTGVFPRVSDEGRGDGEGHAAQVALVGLLAGVAPLVVGERAGLGEGLAAHVAHVRLLPAVQPAAQTGGQPRDHRDPGGGGLPDVDFVVGGRGELEAAALARVRLLLAVVHPPVGHQLALLSKALVTVGAVEGLLTWKQHPREKVSRLGATRVPVLRSKVPVQAGRSHNTSAVALRMKRPNQEARR